MGISDTDVFGGSLSHFTWALIMLESWINSTNHVKAYRFCVGPYFVNFRVPWPSSWLSGSRSYRSLFGQNTQLRCHVPIRRFENSESLTTCSGSKGLIIKKTFIRVRWPNRSLLTQSEHIDLAWDHIWQVTDPWDLALDLDCGKKFPVVHHTWTSTYILSSIKIRRKPWTDGRTWCPVFQGHLFPEMT